MIAGAVSAPWLDAPLRRFVQDSRVQRAIVLHPDGKVLGQFGFTSASEVMTACGVNRDELKATVKQYLDGELGALVADSGWANTAQA